MLSQQAEDLIRKNLEARGGVDKLLNLKTFKITGKIKIEGVELPFVYMRKNPDKTRFQVKINNQNSVTAFIGDSGWTIDPTSGKNEPVRMSLEEVYQKKPLIDYYFVFIDYTLLNSPIFLSIPTYAGKDTINGKENQKLIINTKYFADITYFINSKTNLETMHTIKFKYLPETFTVKLKDFYDIKGFMVPHILETSNGKNRTIIMTVDNIQLDNAISDEVFEMN